MKIEFIESIGMSQGEDDSEILLFMGRDYVRVRANDDASLDAGQLFMKRIRNEALEEGAESVRLEIKNALNINRSKGE